MDNKYRSTMTIQEYFALGFAKNVAHQISPKELYALKAKLWTDKAAALRKEAEKLTEDMTNAKNVVKANVRLKRTAKFDWQATRTNYLGK